MPAGHVIRSGSTLPLSRWQVLLACWPIKFMAPVLGLSAFFTVYFAVLRHPLFSVTLMPMTSLDRWVGFHPAAFGLYVSLWLYILVAPGTMTTCRELAFYYAGWVVLAVIGLSIFLLWPTATPAPNIDWARYPGVAFLKRVDSSGNACPSLHAAFVVFTAMWSVSTLRRFGDRGVLRALSLLWALGILYSTLATKQHVLVDLIGGCALGAAVAAVHLHLWRRWFVDARPARPARRLTAVMAEDLE